MTDKIDVLNHGFVRLVNSMGTDLDIVRNARVSYDAAWRAGEDTGSDSRLINFLYKNGHNTPFEAVTFTFEVQAPIFVIRQWQRHRTWSYNELSARYRELPEEFYVPEPELIGKQSTDNKQMRVEAPVTLFSKARSTQIKRACEESFKSYRNLLSHGVPRELARGVLPMNTYTHMFATVNLNNLFKFLTERQHEHAQYEIRVYADALLELIKPLVPVAVEAFESKRLNQQS